MQHQPIQLTKEFAFEAAHHLPAVPNGHKCRRLHGHSYKIVVTVTGPMDEKLGWILDLGEISTAFKPLMDQLDHRYLNEVPGLENPTSENLALWIFRRLTVSGATLVSVTVKETCTSSVTVYAEPKK